MPKSIMTAPVNDTRLTKTILVALAVAVAGYLPAALAYDTITRILSPMGHAEEAMGHGLAMIFIGGPIGALLLAAIAGRWTWLNSERVPFWTPLAILAAGALAGTTITTIL